MGHLEPAERAGTLGVRLTFGHPFPVELRHLLDQVGVLQQDRPVGADGQRVIVTLDRDARGVRRESSRSRLLQVSGVEIAGPRCLVAIRWASRVLSGHPPAAVARAPHVGTWSDPMPAWPAGSRTRTARRGFTPRRSIGTPPQRAFVDSTQCQEGACSCRFANRSRSPRPRLELCRRGERRGSHRRRRDPRVRR